VCERERERESEREREKERESEREREKENFPHHREVVTKGSLKCVSHRKAEKIWNGSAAKGNIL
jgi:hypothetical protein